MPPGSTVRRWIRLSPSARGRITGAAAALSRGLPVHVGAQRWDVVGRRLADWAEPPYDLVWFGGLDHAVRLGRTASGHRTVVDCDDVETDKWRAYLAAGSGDRVERLQRRVELPLWARVQSRVARTADAVVVCSELDVGRFGGTRTVVVPNTYPAPASPPDPRPRPRTDRPRVLMVASWGNDQNLDAARHAVRDVLPALHERLPGAVLRLVGRGADRLADLVRGHDGVELVGAVDDVGPELAAADVVLVPMRFGGGTRLKVLEAFAHGVPVVSTTLGCEGTGAVDGQHLLVRDGPGELAAGVAQVAADPALGDALVRAGRALHAARFTPDAAVAAVTDLVERLLPTQTGPPPAPNPT